MTVHMFEQMLWLSLFPMPVASSNSNGRSKHALALHQIHAAHACVSGRQQCFTVMLHSHVAQSCCVVMLYSHAV